jgi:hypothetical protein
MDEKDAAEMDKLRATQAQEQAALRQSGVVHPCVPLKTNLTGEQLAAQVASLDEKHSKQVANLKAVQRWGRKGCISFDSMKIRKKLLPRCS